MISKLLLHIFGFNYYLYKILNASQATGLEASLHQSHLFIHLNESQSFYYIYNILNFKLMEALHSFIY